MSYDKFKELLSYVTDDWLKEDTAFRRPVGPDQRLGVCLRFLSTGDSFTSIALSFNMGECPVRGIVHETCEIIWTRLSLKILPASDNDAWLKIAERFEEKWNFPNCIGALDGKHIVIQAPPNGGTMYFNCKKTFSIVLMALVDADYRFIAINVAAFGKNSDGGILANSTFRNKIYNGSINIPTDKPLPDTDHPVIPYVIVGDQAFPLNKNIMRSYPGAHLHDDESKKILNYRLSRARRVSENAFGILSQEFRIYQRRINLKPEHVNKVVLAACCLHIFLRNDVLQHSANLPSILQRIPNLILPLNNPYFREDKVNAAIAIREIFRVF